MKHPGLSGQFGKNSRHPGDLLLQKIIHAQRHPDRAVIQRDLVLVIELHLIRHDIILFHDSGNSQNGIEHAVILYRKFFLQRHALKGQSGNTGHIGDCGMVVGFIFIHHFHRIHDHLLGLHHRTLRIFPRIRSHFALHHDPVFVKIHIAVQIPHIADDLLFIDMEPDLAWRHLLDLYVLHKRQFIRHHIFPEDGQKEGVGSKGAGKRHVFYFFLRISGISHNLHVIHMVHCQKYDQRNADRQRRPSHNDAKKSFVHFFSISKTFIYQQ